MLGQGDEFPIIEIRQLHPPGAPVGFGLLDPLPGGGDEIPFNESLADRLTAEQHDGCALRGRDEHGLAGREYQHLSAAEASSLHLDGTQR